MSAASKSALFLTPLVLWSTLVQADLNKVAEYLNKGSATPIVSVVNGALVAPEAKSKDVPGHFIEDCRKASIRQGILDASAKSNATIELSRAGSHRMEITGRRQEIEKVIGALVGIRTISKGLAQETTFSYLLDDPSQGTCKIIEIDAPVAGMIGRKDQEAKVLAEVLPKLPPTRLDWLRKNYSKKGPLTDADIAKKSVGKLIDLECEQYSINQAVELARQAYQAKNPGTQAIIFLDYENSKVVSEATSENKHAEVTKMTGFWALRLSDATATKTMSAKVSFDLTENKKSCTGPVNPQVEVAP